MPSVSVVMPVRDQIRYIEEALNSVYAQTLPCCELIVINDGSTDGTEDILRTHAREGRLTLIDFKAPVGIVTALNTGIEAATGNYIARMDGDDIMMPNRLEAQLGFMQSHPYVDLCGSCVVCFDESNSLSPGVVRFQQWHNALLTHEQMVTNMYVDSPIVHPTFFGEKRFFIRLDGYRETGFAEDYDMLLRAIFEGLQLAKIETPLLKWRDHGNRAIRQNKSLTKTSLFRQKASFFKAHKELSSRPIYMFGVGRFGKALLRALLSEGIPVEGVIDPSGKRRESGISQVPVLEMDATLPTHTLLINALPMHNSQIGKMLKKGRGIQISHWVL